MRVRPITASSAGHVVTFVRCDLQRIAIACPLPPPQIRALAIMSQHLLSPQLEPDDKNTQLFLDAFFEAKALKSILKVRSVTHPPVRGAHSSS